MKNMTEAQYKLILISQWSRQIAQGIVLSRVEINVEPGEQSTIIFICGYSMLFQLLTSHRCCASGGVDFWFLRGRGLWQNSASTISHCKSIPNAVIFIDPAC